MQEITLTLTIDETNLILEALGQQPFAKVYALVDRIQSQAGQQLNAGGIDSAESPEQPEA